MELKRKKTAIRQVYDCDNYQAAQCKIRELRAKEKDLVAKIEGLQRDRSDVEGQTGNLLQGKEATVVCDTTFKTVLSELHVVRKDLQLAGRDLQDAHRMAAQALCKSLEPEAKQIARKTFKALCELTEAVQAERNFDSELNRAGISDLFRPPSWRLMGPIKQPVFWEDFLPNNQISCKK